MQTNMSIASSRPNERTPCAHLGPIELCFEKQAMAKGKGLGLFSDRELYINKRKSLESQQSWDIGKHICLTLGSPRGLI